MGNITQALDILILRNDKIAFPVKHKDKPSEEGTERGLVLIQDIEARMDLTSLNIAGSIETTPGTCTLIFSIPTQKLKLASGGYDFSNVSTQWAAMDHIEVFISENPTNPYRRMFAGIVTQVGTQWKEGIFNITVNAKDMLYWLSLQKAHSRNSIAELFLSKTNVTTFNKSGASDAKTPVNLAETMAYTSQYQGIGLKDLIRLLLTGERKRTKVDLKTGKQTVEESADQTNSIETFDYIVLPEMRFTDYLITMNSTGTINANDLVKTVTKQSSTIVEPSKLIGVTTEQDKQAQESIRNSQTVVSNAIKNMEALKDTPEAKMDQYAKNIILKDRQKKINDVLTDYWGRKFISYLTSNYVSFFRQQDIVVQNDEDSGGAEETICPFLIEFSGPPLLTGTYETKLGLLELLSSTGCSVYEIYQAPQGFIFVKPPLYNSIPLSIISPDEITEITVDEDISKILTSVTTTGTMAVQVPDPSKTLGHSEAQFAIPTGNMPFVMGMYNCLFPDYWKNDIMNTDIPEIPTGAIVKNKISKSIFTLEALEQAFKDYTQNKVTTSKITFTLPTGDKCIEDILSKDYDYNTAKIEMQATIFNTLCAPYRPIAEQFLNMGDTPTQKVVPTIDIIAVYDKLEKRMLTEQNTNTHVRTKTERHLVGQPCVTDFLDDSPNVMRILEVYGGFFIHPDTTRSDIVDVLTRGLTKSNKSYPFVTVGSHSTRARNTITNSVIPNYKDPVGDNWGGILTIKLQAELTTNYEEYLTSETKKRLDTPISFGKYNMLEHGIKDAKIENQLVRSEDAAVAFSQFLLERNNASVETTTIRLATFRPDIIPGFPTFNAVDKAIYYVSGIALTIVPGNEVSTTLTCIAKRPSIKEDSYYGSNLITLTHAFYGNPVLTKKEKSMGTTPSSFLPNYGGVIYKKVAKEKAKRGAATSSTAAYDTYLVWQHANEVPFTLFSVKVADIGTVAQGIRVTTWDLTSGGSVTSTVFPETLGEMLKNSSKHAIGTLEKISDPKEDPTRKRFKVVAHLAEHQEIVNLVNSILYSIQGDKLKRVLGTDAISIANSLTTGTAYEAIKIFPSKYGWR